MTTVPIQCFLELASLFDIHLCFEIMIGWYTIVETFQSRTYLILPSTAASVLYEVSPDLSILESEQHQKRALHCCDFQLYLWIGLFSCSL